jgi:phosphoglucosamine mutase
MSNLGLENYIKNQGLDFIRTNVGDRHVAARMYEGGYNLGRRAVWTHIND